MKKTLVIHPKDPTTDVLCEIYRDRAWTIIRDPETSMNEIKRQIRLHDRIIMLGHGTPQGLLASHQEGEKYTQFYRFIINSDLEYELRNKETLSIWCNSDAFFRKLGLKGLHTGMIISEVQEEMYVLGKEILTKEEMYENMKRFSEAFRKNIDEEDVEEMKRKILEEYTGKDEVTKHNREKIIII